MLIALFERRRYRLLIHKSRIDFQVKQYRKIWGPLYRHLCTDTFPQSDIYYGLVQYERAGVTFKDAMQNIFCDRLGYSRLKTTIILRLFKF